MYTEVVKCPATCDLVVIMDITKWSDEPWSEGRIIRGRYRILNYVGSSAVGYVYRAEHLRLQSLCALKVLGRQAADEGRSEWFERVAILERKLQHPNAVRVAIVKPACMSPEQVTAKEPDGRSDIYSLGIVMYQMLTGQLPFPQEADWSMQIMDAHLRVPPVPIRSVRADIPEALAGLVMKCLEKSPDRRPESCSLLVTELDAFGPYGGSQVS